MGGSSGLFGAGFSGGDPVVAGRDAQDQASQPGQGGGYPGIIGRQDGSKQLAGSDKDAAKGGFPGFQHSVMGLRVQFVVDFLQDFQGGGQAL